MYIIDTRIFFYKMTKLWEVTDFFYITYLSVIQKFANNLEPGLKIILIKVNMFLKNN